MLNLDFWRSAYDHALGRPKTAFPTRYHYIEILRDDFIERGVTISRLGQHNLLLNDKRTGRELIVVVRYTTERDLRLVSRRKQTHSSRIAYLIDDDYWAMLDDDGLRLDYRARLDRFLTNHYTRLYPLLDAVVAPSRQILDKFPDLPGSRIQPVHLSPSGDLSHFDNPAQIRMVFLGTSTHGADFKKVAPGIAAALKGNPQLHLTTLLGKRGGELLPESPQVSHMGDMFFPQFQSWLSTRRFHIGLAPYEPNLVNDGRSNLKFHQHALVGAAGIYSKTTPFLECVENKVDGMLLDYEPKAWKEMILLLSKDWASVKELAKGGVTKTSSIQTHYETAESWISLL